MIAGVASILAACGGPGEPASPPSTADKRVDAVGTLGVLALGRDDDGTPRIGTVSASLRGWHHGPSLDPKDLHLLPYDAVYVGWELTAGAATIKGDAGVVWQLDAVEAGRARFDALRVTSCGPSADGGPVAFRVSYAPDEPPDASADDGLRVAVPDRVGAAVARAPAGTGSCDEALAWAGDAAGWRRDRSAGAAVCAHLYRLGAGEDAVRCLLREPVVGGAERVSRQALPRAPDDPGFDALVLGALEPGVPGDPAGFAPYRVGELVAEVRDREAVGAVADRIALATGEGPGALLPWQVGLVAAAARGDAQRTDRLVAWAEALVARWATDGDPADAASAELALSVVADGLPADRLAELSARAAARPPPAACAPTARPARERCGDPARALTAAGR